MIWYIHELFENIQAYWVVDRGVTLATTSKKYRQSTHAEQGEYTQALKRPRPARLPRAHRMLNLSNALSFFPDSSRRPQTFHIFIASSR